ncbi:hypothetical protein OG410_19930 [Streptomyces sp. NBC_00659]|uniref:hypothetical protein n=1 Tax=Streptomyces sp. NBC_00659 TaxID=2903669 RepID=UPI002E3178D2|nr:hypothetical protein [Streptomyces sp. NBC_00659]
MTEQTTPVDDMRPVEDTTQVEQEASAERDEPRAAEPQAPVPQPEQPTVVAEAGTEAGAEAAVPPSPVAPPVAGEPEVPLVKVKKDRRVLRAVLRWTAATLVFAAVGSSVAYGITRMERTDVPGLATKADGRWDYPAIVKPPLPSGSPGPFAESNKAGVHSADLRKLLLPSPKGAKADPALRGEDGWLAKKSFVAQYAEKTDRDTVDQVLTDHALRHIAARGWTTPDGTHTQIYLLQFDTAAVVDLLYQDEFTNWGSPGFALRGAASMQSDEVFAGVAQLDDIARYTYTETKPYGAEQVRQAYLAAGDTLGLVVQSRKGSARAIPFQQTVVLQSQLLG